MKSAIVAVILGLSMSSFAEEAKPEYKTMDLQQFNNVTKPATKSKITFSTSCTAADGRVLESDSTEYTSCMQSTKPKDKSK